MDDQNCSWAVSKGKREGGVVVGSHREGEGSAYHPDSRCSPCLPVPASHVGKEIKDHELGEVLAEFAACDDPLERFHIRPAAHSGF